MKQIIHTLMLGALTLLAIYLYFLTDTSINGVIIKEEPLIDVKLEEREAFNYLNRLRVGAGLIPLTLNSTLQTTAKNHANYLIENRTIGHREDSSKKGFTGEYGSQRSIYSGYKTSMVIENISNNNFNSKESIDGLMGAIYHRFGFLDFHIDEIGIGIAQHDEHRGETAFVYDMGSHSLEEICQRGNSVKYGKYVGNVCADKNLKIRAEVFNRVLEQNRYRNKRVVIYPFEGQIDVPPAFYDELPDPLPEYSVSGFPISISFNESYFQSVKMVEFKLYNSAKKEVKDVKFYDNSTDPNRRFKKFEFALFPLKRLAWGSRYMVEAKYLVDGHMETKIWSFKTREFQEPFHKVTDGSEVFDIELGKSAIFYFPPLSKKDVLGNLMYPSNLDISFIDKNTIKLVANGIRSNSLTLKIGSHQLRLNIKDAI